MAVSIPSAHPGIDVLPLAAGQDIVDDELLRIVQADAYSYAYKGSVAHSKIYNPAWTTSSTTFTASTSSSSFFREDLNQRWPRGHALRRALELDDPLLDLYTGTDVYIWTLSLASSLNLELRAVISTDGGVSSAIVGITPSTTYSTGRLILPVADGDEHTFRLEARSTDGSPASIYGITIYEAILAVEDLPLGV